jgi:hypothetical protein
LGSHYFESHIWSRRTRVSRNDEGFEDQFLQPGRTAGQQMCKVIEEKEKNAAHLHVL